ncbi:MAG: Maf family protein, partial [Acidobacteriota bacterium]
GGKLAHRLARAKALAVASRLRRPGWVLGADTVVILQGRILGKPRDEHHARSMLEDLSGRLHRAITALVLEPARIPGAHALSGLSTTQVRFAPLPAARISWLMASGEHRDKAGAYAVQGRAACFITELRGSYTNVVGLPLGLLFNMLETIGFFRPRRSER